MVFKPSTTAAREIEPTVIEQIQPTKMFLPEIAITPTVERVFADREPKVIELKEEPVNVVKEEEVNELKEEKQNSLIPEVEVENPKPVKVLFQEKEVVKVEEKEEIVPVTESPISYEEEEEEEDEDEEESVTEKVKEPGNVTTFLNVTEKL